MLISSDISSLGKALHSDSPNLETKGIASHRAPVSTINAHRIASEITHQSFYEALKEEFAAAYPGDMKATVVREGEVDLPKVWDGVKELKVGLTGSTLTAVMGMAVRPNTRIHQHHLWGAFRRPSGELTAEPTDADRPYLRTTRTHHGTHHRTR